MYHVFLCILLVCCFPINIQYLNCLLQLGGKNAAVIFDDADLEKCLSTTLRLIFDSLIINKIYWEVLLHN